MVLSQREEKDNASIKDRSSQARRASVSRREMVVVVVAPPMELTVRT